MLKVASFGRTPCLLDRHIVHTARVFHCRQLSTQPSPPKQRSRWTLPVFGLATGVAALYFFLPDPSRHAPTSSRSPLSATHFTPTTVVSNVTSGPDTKILRLKVAPHLIPKDDPVGFGPVWSVFIKDDDIQVERPYTPLKGIDEDGNMIFWIKKYPRGEVGRWLHSKQPGDTIEIRGPLKTWPWKEGEWDEIVFISGGTGITPFSQLIYQVFENPSKYPSNARFTLLHSSRTPEELPSPQLLAPLINYAEKHPENFRMQLFVDEDDGSKPPLPVSSLGIGRFNDDHLKKILGIPEPNRWQRWFGKKPQFEVPQRTLFLVCGPEPMIAAVAGPYGRNYSQGPTLGILGRLGLTSKQVWKL